MRNGKEMTASRLTLSLVRVSSEKEALKKGEQISSGKKESSYKNIQQNTL